MYLLNHTTDDFYGIHTTLCASESKEKLQTKLDQFLEERRQYYLAYHKWENNFNTWVQKFGVIPYSEIGNKRMEYCKIEAYPTHPGVYGQLEIIEVETL